MPRGLDEWTEAITRVTQLGSRTHRQRQNHTQYFHAKSRDIATVSESTMTLLYDSTAIPNKWAGTTASSDDGRWDLFAWD